MLERTFGKVTLGSTNPMQRGCFDKSFGHRSSVPNRLSKAAGGLHMSQTMMMPDVLTLEEVANYLRLPKETIQREAAHGQIPGRLVDDTWSFLKAAIDDWLRSRDGRTILLQQAGALATDETLPQLRVAIYAERGRPEYAEDSDS
jgi:excisionase family DNA binding protein